MSKIIELPTHQVGWCFSHSGLPIVFLNNLDDPRDAVIIPQDNWWRALRSALEFAHLNPWAEFVGGPQ